MPGDADAVRGAGYGDRPRAETNDRERQCDWARSSRGAPDLKNRGCAYVSEPGVRPRATSAPEEAANLPGHWEIRFCGRVGHHDSREGVHPHLDSVVHMSKRRNAVGSALSPKPD